MNNVDKALMLAESFGADASSFTSSYVESIVKSEAFLTLSENVRWAENFSLVKAVALVEDYKSLNYKVDTFEDSIVLASRINYLCSVSDESYYLNPLLKYQVKTRTKSIGELKISYDGNDISINDMIKDEAHPLPYKAKMIERKCESWRQEISSKMAETYRKTQNNYGLTRLVRKNLFWLVLKGIIVISCFLFDLYMFITRRSRFVLPLQSFDPKNIFAYGLYVFLLSSGLCLLFWLLMAARYNRLYASYFYFSRFGRTREARFLKEGDTKAQKLAEYIFLAAESRRGLKDDISDFSLRYYLGSEIELYKRAYQADEDRPLHLFSVFFNAFFVMLVVSGLYCLVFYLLQRFAGI